MMLPCLLKMRRTHQDEEDPSPLFYLDREESVGMEWVEHEEEVDVIIMQLKRQKKQEETQRRRQGQITEADKDEDERMPERLVFGARDTAVLFNDKRLLSNMSEAWIVVQ